MVIVPSVDVRDGRASFGAGSPGEQARRFVQDGAEELHLVDLDAAERGVARNARLLEGIAIGSGVPCRLAGGLADVARARDALERGFAGVLFSSAVFGDDALLRDVAEIGESAIVEIEARDGLLSPRGGEPRLVDAARGLDAIRSAIEAAGAGVRALYVIDLGGEGRLGGPALALLDRVRAALERDGHRLALHTGGGVRDLGDVRAVAQRGAASVVVGRALAERRFTIAEAKAACA